MRLDLLGWLCDLVLGRDVAGIDPVLCLFDVMMCSSTISPANICEENLHPVL